MNRIQYIAIAAACVCLSACGGGEKPTPAPDLIATSPKSSAQIVAPASETAASEPVAASEPASTTTAPAAAAAAPVAPDATASAPVAASAPAASEPVASAPVPASTPAMASTPVIKIAIYGDDQSEGIAFSAMGMPTIVSNNEAQALQALLQKSFNDSGIQVINASTGGTSSSLPNELDGMDGLGAAEPQRMAQSGAQIVIEAHGLNDALGGETLSEYSAYLGQWIQDAQTAGVTPVLESDAPVCDGDHPQLSAYATAMDAASKQFGIPVIDQYAAISSVNGWQAGMLNCLVPNAALDQLKAQQDAIVLAPLVQKLIGS